MMTLSKKLSKHTTNSVGRYTIINPSPKLDEKICVISDSAVIKEGISSIFQQELNIKEITLTSKNNFIEKHTNTNFRIIITDIDFIDGCDTNFIEQIRSVLPNSKIIVYTSPKNRNQRIKALEYGSDFFIYFDDDFKLLEFIVKRIITGLVNKN